MRSAPGTDFAPAARLERDALLRQVGYSASRSSPGSCSTRCRLLLEQLCALCRAHEVAAGRALAVAAESEDLLFVSDRGLLTQVLGNMLKNALEAVPAGEEVTLGCRRDGGRIELWVHNPGVIPRSSQLQIFQRSFSTRGRGAAWGPTACAC